MLDEFEQNFESPDEVTLLKIELQRAQDVYERMLAQEQKRASAAEHHLKKLNDELTAVKAANHDLTLRLFKEKNEMIEKLRRFMAQNELYEMRITHAAEKEKHLRLEIQRLEAKLRAVAGAVR